MASKKSFAKTLDRKLRSLDYDPVQDLYKDRAKQLAAHAVGAERLAYEILGSDLMGSIAFALDPYEKIKFARKHIVKVNREKTFLCIPNQRRFFTRLDKGSTYGRTISDIPAQNAENTVYFTAEDSKTELNPQPAINGFLKDTSRRTRGPGEDFGEFELYVPTLQSLGYNYSKLGNTSLTTLDIGSYHNLLYGSEHINFGFSAPSIYLQQSDHDSFKSSYRNELLSIIDRETPGLLASTLPTSRRFNLSYNIAELKDLPMLLRETVRFYKDVLGAFKSPKDLGDLYLAYKFGWESTVQSVLQLISLPRKISKEVNFYVDHRGKPVTLHGRKTISGVPSSVLTLSNDYSFWDEYFGNYISQSVSCIHSVLINLTLNVNLPIPRIDLPSYRADLLSRKFGLEVLNPVDYYNLVPWTWLEDWFTGIGDYLKIIEAIHYDQSIINYGMVSAKAKYRATLDFTGKSSAVDTVVVEPPFDRVDTTRTYTSSRTGLFECRYNIRRDISDAVGVKKVSNMSGLSSYQASIITALLAKYSK
jgi:hypothetical protein